MFAPSFSQRAPELISKYLPKEEEEKGSRSFTESFPLCWVLYTY